MPLWPIIWIVVLASVARLKLGFWPSYDHPDPKDLHWPVLGNGEAVWLFLLALIGLVISLVATLYSWYTGRRDWRFFPTFVSFLVLVLWIYADPGGLFSWWAD